MYAIPNLTNPHFFYLETWCKSMSLRCNRWLSLITPPYLFSLIHFVGVAISWLYVVCSFSDDELVLSYGLDKVLWVWWYVMGSRAIFRYRMINVNLIKSQLSRPKSPWRHKYSIKLKTIILITLLFKAV